MPDLQDIYEQDLAKNLNPTSSMRRDAIPLAERKSENLGIWDDIKEVAPIIILTKLGGLVGYLLGKSKGGSVKILEHQISSELLGLGVGAKIGGIYGFFLHWKRNRGSQLGVENLNSDLKEAMSAEHLKSDVKKEQEIIDSISYLTDEKAKNMSYADYITSRRQAVSGVKEIQ